MRPSGCSPNEATNRPASKRSGPGPVCPGRARAGVSRATPGYFFGSKADLHRAVLERCFAEVRQAVREGRERARASGKEPEIVLAGVVSDYFDFITANPNFVRLIEWEALSGGRQLQDSPHLEVAQEALAAVQEELDFEQPHHRPLLVPPGSRRHSDPGPGR